jgi:hypothetical protein
MTITDPFLWNGSSKIQIFTDIWYLFCWKLLRPTYAIFWKLVDETQILYPQEYTDTFKQNLTCIFVSLRAILKETFQCEKPCIKNKESIERSHRPDIRWCCSSPSISLCLFELISDSSAQAAYLPERNVWSVTSLYTLFFKDHA